MSQCTKDLQKKGVPYPRTCAECGLGPCKRYPPVVSVDDAEVMRIWRECGLPEYFLGNGGTNHKLVAFAKACAALRKRPIAWMRYVSGDAQFRHASDEGDPPEDEGWIALYRRRTT